VSNPTVVEGLQGKYIVSIACGWHHTAGDATSSRHRPRAGKAVSYLKRPAALTDSGQLYTWGSGECAAPFPALFLFQTFTGTAASVTETRTVRMLPK
jgi:hypothetical protein